MRGSHYLNAATNEVDAATDLYESIFPLIEKVSTLYLQDEVDSCLGTKSRRQS